MLNNKLLFIVATIFLYSAVSAPAQNSADSVEKVLVTRSLSDKATLDVYKKLCDQYQQNNPVKMREYCEKGLKLAEQLNDRASLGVFYSKLAVYYANRSSHDTAIVYYRQALELAEEVDNKRLQSVVNANIALSYSAKGDYTAELEYDLRALALCEQIGNRTTMTTLLVNMATTYRTLRDYDRALELLDRANRIAEEIDFAHGKIIVAYAYGIICHDRHENAQAIGWLEKAAKLCRQENDLHFLILCLQSMAVFYSDDENPTTFDLEKAEEYANESMQLAEAFGDPFRISGSLRMLAHISLLKGQYRQSEALGQRAWLLDSTDLDVSHDLAAVLCKANINLGNRSAAVHFFDSYRKLNGEKTKQNLQETLLGLEMQYETEKKEVHIATLEREKRLYLGIAAAIAVLLLTISLYQWRFHRQDVRRLEQERQIAAARSAIEIESAERMRIARDLHDDINPMLASIKFSLVDDVEALQKARALLDHSMEEVRRIAHNLMPASLERFGMRAAIEDFCSSLPNVHFRFFGDGRRIDNSIEILMYRCVHELVYNAVKYADASSINVQLEQSAERVALTVQDNGRGFDPASARCGMGLRNLRDRLIAFSGTMEIVSNQGEGSETYIELKLR
jgi:signal transduction histidine kinase